ncbi:MAG TPA: hypothetical protein VIK74_11915, partial [Parasegetibacter sp.]
IFADTILKETIKQIDFNKSFIVCLLIKAVNKFPAKIAKIKTLNYPGGEFFQQQNAGGYLEFW